MPCLQLEASEIQSVLQYQNIIIQHMDILEPLTTLRKLLETRLQCSLADHEFYLQDAIQVWRESCGSSNCLIIQNPLNVLEVDFFLKFFRFELFFK